MLINLNKILLVIIITSSMAYAETQTKVRNIPFYASIKSNSVNARTGPNQRYPINWTYVKKGEPVEVIAKFDQWYKIKDYQNEESWVHFNMLSLKRYVIVSQGDELFSSANTLKNKIAQIESGVRAELKECEKNRCLIKIQDLKGWINKKNIWGIYSKEFD